nr:GNAT family N-acetyltransferase [Acinetobacter beijerinckii]
MRMDGQEAAFLSYDDWSEKYIGFIYEIYVLLPEYRYQGIGELLLSYAESKVYELKCRYIKLKPYPLDEKTDKDRLIAWYKKNGYFQSSDVEEVMKKKLDKIKF